jgi:uncharacterized integral membrane protein (TIGR00697 family)
MITLTSKQLGKLLCALAVYLTSLIAANTLGIKLMPFLFGSHVSVAVVSFPFVFLTTDVIGEVYGKHMARWFVVAGFLMTVLFMVYTIISLLLPWSADGIWALEGYNAVFGLSVRVAVASVCAFAVAEYQDVVLFFLTRDRFHIRAFWLRSLLSNVWSQLLDSILFMVIAFAGVYETRTLISIIITWWLYKVLVGFLYTPLSYIGIYMLRDEKHAKA